MRRAPRRDATMLDRTTHLHGAIEEAIILAGPIQQALGGGVQLRWRRADDAVRCRCRRAGAHAAAVHVGGVIVRDGRLVEDGTDHGRALVAVRQEHDGDVDSEWGGGVDGCLAE